MIPIIYLYIAITIIASNSDNFKITEAKFFIKNSPMIPIIYLLIAITIIASNYSP